MKLFELFDKQTPVKWTQMDQNGGTAQFILGRVGYVVNISPREIQNQPGWYIMFTAQGMRDEQPRIDNTGTGNQFEVYSTVIQCIREFVGKMGLRPFAMAAKDDGRMSLYQRFLRKMLPPGWQVGVSGEMITALPPAGQKTAPPGTPPPPPPPPGSQAATPPGNNRTAPPGTPPPAPV